MEGGTATQHIYLGDTRIASVDNAGKIRYFHTNHLGSSHVVTDENGAPKGLFEYKPYGEFSREENYETGEQAANFYFTNQYRDKETGLYYYGARYYNPEIGRFISADTIVQNPKNPVTFNRYHYSANNPVNYIDPDGHGFFRKFFGKVLGAIAAAIVTIAGHPELAFAAFNIVDTVASAGQALVAGASPGRVFGAIGLSIGLNIIVPRAGPGLGRWAQIGINAVRGAAIAVATTAAVSGDRLGSAAAWGGGTAALGTFLATTQAGTAGDRKGETENPQGGTDDQGTEIPDATRQTNQAKDPVLKDQGAAKIRGVAQNTDDVVVKVTYTTENIPYEPGLQSDYLADFGLGVAALAVGKAGAAVAGSTAVQSTLVFISENVRWSQVPKHVVAAYGYYKAQTMPLLRSSQVILQRAQQTIQRVIK